MTPSAECIFLVDVSGALPRNVCGFRNRGWGEWIIGQLLTLVEGKLSLREISPTAREDATEKHISRLAYIFQHASPIRYRSALAAVHPLENQHPKFKTTLANLAMMADTERTR